METQEPSGHIEVEFVRVSDAAQVPVYMTAGAAGADLRSVQEEVIAPGHCERIATGLHIAVPPGYAAFVLPRSGLASRCMVTVLNSPGLIDSDYRGPLDVLLMNHHPFDPLCVRVGDRIAQLVVVPIPTVRFVERTQLDDTVRGTGGFGSTGAV